MEDTNDAGARESDIDGAPLRCIGDKSMEQDTVIYLSKASNGQMGCSNKYFVRVKDPKYLVDQIFVSAKELLPK